MNKQLLEHSIDVAALSTNIAYEMDLCPYIVTQIGIAALYHDIGKECVPKVILENKGKLTDKEKKIMAFHTYMRNA
jgi:putative nucleotidyltransferase with HDIG domain